jgi:predicted Zn finger-like uncharacterized protein
MALLTSCPQCHTTFRISEDALRKAGGQVRCGRCSNIFNAHSQLRDSDAAPKARPAPASELTRTSAPVSAPAPAPAPVAAPVRSPSGSDWPELIDLPPPDPETRTRTPAPAPPAEEAAYAAASMALEIHADDFGRTELESGSDLGGGSDLGSGGDLGGGSGFSRDEVAETLPSPGAELGAAAPSGLSGRWTVPHLAATFGPDRIRLWKSGVAVAGALLLVQVAHSFSDVLATRVPLVQSVYAALGVTLVPRWDLDRYEVLGATATTKQGESGRGNLVIAARIRNRGTVAQPYPQVQLRLLDRWERTVGRRAFAPADYSTTSVARDAMLAPGASVTAELVVVDPGTDAAGFEIDVCVDGATGLRCDGDEVFE